MRARSITIPMNDPISRSPALWESGFYRLLAWLSPGFPVGAFSFSHGLEAAVEGGAVRDHASLQHWIGAVLALGSGRIDVDILRDAHCALRQTLGRFWDPAGSAVAQSASRNARRASR